MPAGVDPMVGEDFASVGDCGDVEAVDEHDDGCAVVGATDAEVHHFVRVAE